MRPPRARWTWFAAMGLVASSCAGGAGHTAVGGTSTSPGTTRTAPPPAMLGPGRQGSTSDVPWARVGAGWILATWNSGSRGAGTGSPDSLFLVDPVGGRYDLGPVPAGVALVDWSGDGLRALFKPNPSAGTPSTATVLDLKQGSTQTFAVTGDGDVSFTKPDGLAVLAGGENPATGVVPERRYGLSGGVEATYPSKFPHGGAAYGNAVESPDGTSLAMGTAGGIEVFGNSGKPTQLLSPRPGQSHCTPIRWWDASTVLAFCDAGLWRMPASGAAPTTVTGSTNSDFLNVWSLGRSIVAQAAACGTEWLDAINPDGSATMLTIPGTPSGGSDFGLAAYGARLAVLITGGCDGGRSAPAVSTLAWYELSGSSMTPLLGTGANGGTVDTAVVFPGAG